MPIPQAPEVGVEAQGPPTPRAVAKTVLAGVTLVLVYLAGDVLFAAPIAVATRVLGTWLAFAILSVVFALGSFILSLLALRAYDRSREGAPSRLELWIERQASSRRGLLGARMLRAGKVLGFVVSSFLLGGIITTWLIRYSGRREGMVGVAALSSAIFGITFVGAYAGVFGLIFSAW